MVYPCLRIATALALITGLSGCVATPDGEQVARIAPANVDANLILGTHAIGGPYQLTDQPYLLEVARELESMGSSQFKFTATPKYTRKPYFLKPVSGIDSLTDLLETHPVYREILSMGFRDYFFWASPFGNVRWQDGITEDEGRLLYNEMRDLAEFLLTRYNGTGKEFHVGHWEGDWLLLPGRDPDDDPSPARIRGFTQYLNIRQAAIEDARNSVPHKNVAIYHYAEVNLVMKGIDGKRATLTNAVLPHVDVDFVSYSSYDSIQGEGMKEKVKQALDHIESNMKPRPHWKGKRVYAGEFAIRASLVDFDKEEHDRRNREVISVFLEWGCPYILYWQVYCNEPRPDLEQGYNGFWLIDPEGTKYPLYYTLSNYWRSARTYIDQVKSATGQPPSAQAIREYAIDYFKS